MTVFNLDRTLKSAITAHLAGKVDEAAHFYRAILNVKPSHPDANHNIGILLTNQGKTEKALPFFKKALESNVNVTQFWFSYLDCLSSLKQWENINKIARQVEDTVIDRNQVKTVRAKCFDIIVQSHLTYFFNLLEKGDLINLRNQADELDKKYPASLDLLNLLGVVHTKLGDANKALQYCTKSLILEPRDQTIYNNLGLLMGRLGNDPKALELFHKATKINPLHVDILYNNGNLLWKEGHLDRAVEKLKTSIIIQPGFIDARNNLGNVLLALGLFEEAISSYRKLITNKPTHLPGIFNLANAYRDKGDQESAKRLYSRILHIEPMHSEAHHAITELAKYKNGDPHLRQILELMKNENLDPNQICHLSFALAKIYDDLGDYRTAFQYLRLGNSKRKKMFKYNVQEDIDLFEKIKKRHVMISEAATQMKIECYKVSPIFIIGMPRSGTTLIEQILSAHSYVSGAGELPYLSKLGLPLLSRDTRLSTVSLENFRANYLQLLDQHANGKKFVTDKTPHNFRLVSLILHTIPEAKIIHVKRDPSATCWSNYKSYFATKGLGYCYDLDDLVSYYHLYCGLMEFWHTQFEDKIITCSYETLTARPEPEIKRVIRALDLQWERSCLSPHRNRRHVRTSSHMQVREKIYSGSSEHWLNYNKYLGGRFEALPRS